MFEILLYFAYILSIVPVIMLKSRKNNTGETFVIKPFAWLLVIAAFYEFFVTGILSIPKSVWFRIYGLLEFTCVFYLLFFLLKKKYKAYFYVFGGIYLIMFVLLSCGLFSISSLTADAYLLLVATLFVFSGAILWFKNLLTSLTVPSLTGHPVFYFISGFIIYFSGSVFLFLTADLILKNDQLALSKFWNLSIVLNIILRLLLIIGIWKGQQKSVQYSG